MGTRTVPHGLGGLLESGPSSSGDPNAPRRNGGTKFYNTIADEHHPDVATSEHFTSPHRSLDDAPILWWVNLTSAILLLAYD